MTHETNGPAVQASQTTAATTGAEAAARGAAGGWTPARMAVMALLVVAALWLGWKSWQVNITMSCWKDEWPNLPVCGDIMGRTPQERVARLEERLRENPGDHMALVDLTVWAHQPGAAPHLDARALLDQAIKVAPQHGDVLRLQVQRAMKAQQWAQAVEPLIRLSRYHHDGDATRALAEMINYAREDKALGEALTAATLADAGWLEKVLPALPKAQVPTVVAMPLVAELVRQDKLTPKLGLALIRQLKAEERWLEAHSVWMQLWKRPLPTLFNGDFEQPFVAGGFDWETTGSNDHRSGAQVSQVGRREHGQVLRVEFRGKQMQTPILRQHLFLTPGRYRFSGEFQSSELRSDQGLAWVFSCAGGERRELARVPSLKAAGRDWQTMALELEVPSECGLGVALTLVPQAAYEARAGMRGEMVFDRLRLESAGAAR